MTRRNIWGAAAALAAILLTVKANAQALDLTKFEAWVDLRGAVSTAGEEWLDGGFSKTRYGGTNDTNADFEIAEATALWEPRFTASLSAHLNLQAGPDQDMPFSAVEAFLRWRMPPKSPWRISAKAGRFYPPISLEHEGPAWTLTRSITPSAINSWIGEEVAVIGLEGRAARVFGDHFFDFRFSAFGFNDTAGTLLSLRGWALHDIRTVIGGSFRVPDDPVRRTIVPLQVERTRPTKELDGRVGFYASARWRYSDLIQVDILAYDNRADPNAIRNGQYGWRTKFFSGGLKYTPVEGFEILVQGMFGSTAMGPVSELDMSVLKFDDTYVSAYVLAAIESGDNRFSVRAAHFRVGKRSIESAQNPENGWAGTVAWIRPVTKHLRVGLEALYTNHDRPILGVAGRTQDVQVQTSIQLRY